MADGAKLPHVQPGGVVPVTIRDGELVRKLLRGAPLSPGKTAGIVEIRVPGAAAGGAGLLIAWPIDKVAWDMRGSDTSGPPTESA